MIAKVLSPDSRLFGFLDKGTDLLVLNLLVALTCLPLVTLGAAVTAAYTVLYEDLGDPAFADLPLHRRYLAGLKAHWKQSTAFFLAQLAAVALLILMTSVARGAALETVFLVLVALSLVVGQVYYVLLAVYGHTRPSLARVISVGRLLRGSVGIAMKYMLFPVLSLCLMAASILVPIFTPKLLFVWLFFGLSLPLWGASQLMRHPLIKSGIIKEPTSANQRV